MFLQGVKEIKSMTKMIEKKKLSDTFQFQANEKKTLHDACAFH